MKTRLLPLTLVCCVAFAGSLLAAASDGKATDKKAAPAKTPADNAYDEFNRERGSKAAKDQAQFKKVIAAAMAYLAEYPTHSRVNEVVSNLASYGNGIDSKQPALRTSYLSNLKLEVTNLRYKEGVSNNTKAALAAVDAAVADFEVRAAFNRENLGNVREKIDVLAEAPGGGRFLADRERSYVAILTVGASPALAEKHLNTLLQHKEKGVASMARTELNLLELKKQPFALAFTGFDGKPVDLAQLRGKVVALYFWSSTSKTSLGNFETLKRLHADYRKKGFEVVTVSYDKAEDREALAAAIKQNKIAWPVYYDGKGAKNDFSPKLNVTSVPALLVFDQGGILQHSMQGSYLTVNLPVSQLEGQVKRLLKIK